MRNEDRVWYQIFTEAFGGLNGVRKNLGYLKELGVKGVWITPMYPSPSYHGYDITDYCNIKPEYGTLEDFKALVKECHERDIKIIIDTVLNHTSYYHPWFKESAAGNPKYRDYYIWKDQYSTENATPMNSEPWSYCNGSYYFNSFCDSMPNLNHENEEVRKEILNIIKFWLDTGIDGFRLDAVRWTFNSVDKGTIFWNWFREEVRELKEDVFMVGEAWDDKATARRYLDAIGSSFNFSLADDIIDKINWNSLKYLGTNLEKMYDNEYKDLEGTDSIFLSNHDQDRIMSKLNNNQHMRKAASLLLTLPGTPFIYYGEEIGTTGVKELGDEYVRQEMKWYAVFLERHLPGSLLNFYKELIKIRNNSKALQKGKFTNMHVDYNNVIAYKRTYRDEEVTVIINGTGPARVNVGWNSYEVLYNNKKFKHVKEVVFKDYIELEDNEILIIKK